jgi:hypothetical protein
MPHINIAFSGGLPIVDLYVGVSTPRRTALEAANRPVPQFQRARALIDTGASGTCIDKTILTLLQITPTGTVPIHTPSTSGVPVVCEEYDVALGIIHPTKDPMVLSTVPVIATELASQGIQALIGRDVLAACLFLYDGAGGAFTLAL